MGVPTGDGHQGDLGGGTGQPVHLRHADEVDAELVGQLGGAGAEQDGAVVTREHRERDDVDALDRSRQELAECELGRVDLSGEDGPGAGSG